MPPAEENRAPGMWSCPGLCQAAGEPGGQAGGSQGAQRVPGGSGRAPDTAPDTPSPSLYPWDRALG